MKGRGNKEQPVTGLSTRWFCGDKLNGNKEKEVGMAKGEAQYGRHVNIIFQ
ncbi:hypothetical protein PPACK8108_LOCUS3443 [Phakopsora pachyrhizi]|uniref:Uncharacterized protein n=1 Tax=Phakopsora pachyrhizi TaxID=170000 RepID=A0AAV0AK17_PHAPC|nr:hypothetical protein PPACK8108_LOCUS3443 [Phakopsora pachyrhizi]